jgi:hypothetical protein
MFGVIPCDPKSLYWVQGLIMLKSITGCIAVLLGGNSFLTLGGLGVAGAFGGDSVAFAGVAVPAAA